MPDADEASRSFQPTGRTRLAGLRRAGLVNLWLLEKAPELRRRILLGTLFFLPLLVLRDLNDPIEIPKLTLLMVVVSIVGSLRICEVLQGRAADTMKAFTVPLAAIAAPLTVAWIFSPYKGWAVFGIYPRYLGLVPYLVVVAFGLLLADAFQGDARPIAQAVTGAGAAAGVYAAIQLMGLDPFEWSVGGEAAPDRYVVATLGNPNFAGAWFATVLPITAALFALDPERRLLTSVALLFILVGWVGAGSEVAWIAGVAGLLILGGWGAAARWQWARVTAAVGAGLLAAAVMGAVIATIAGVDADRLVTAERRGDWWQAAIAMAADSPLVGRGPNAFALEHPRYRTQEDALLVGLDITDDPHSVPLSLLTGAGIAGFVGFMILIGWTVKQGFSVQRGPTLAAAFLGSATVYLVQSLASIDVVSLRFGLWTALAGLVAGTAPPIVEQGRKRKRSSPQKAQPLRRPAAVAVVLALGVCGVALGATLLLNDAQFAHANDLFREGDLNAAQEEFDSAFTVRREIAYRRAYGNLLGDVAVALKDQGESFLEQARDQFSFVQNVPHVNSVVDYARSLRDWIPQDQTTGPASVDLYVRAALLDPRDSALLTEAAFFFLEQNAFEELVLVVDPHVRDINQSGLWGALALAQAELGNVEQAEEAIDKALALQEGELNALAAREALAGEAD